MTTLELLAPMIREVRGVPSLCLDGTALQDIHMCPRKSYDKLIARRKSAREDKALGFGGVMAVGWDWRYKLCGSRAMTKAEEATQMQIIDAAYADLTPGWGDIDEVNPLPLEEAAGKRDYLHVGRAKDVMRAYNAHYRDEPFSVIATERHFEQELGKVRVSDFAVYMPLVWEGRYDMTVETQAGEWPLDQKTMKDWGSAYESDPWKQWRLHSSMLGYCWHRWKESGRMPLGYVIRANVVRPPLKKETKNALPRNQFEEHSFPVTEGQLLEWERDVLATVQTWVRYAEDRYWPKHDKGGYNCKFCEFQPVCLAPDEPTRRVLLDSAAYRVNNWQPGKGATA